MNLNKKSINELRKVVEEKLKTYDKEELIKFDKADLEMLIFNYTNDGKYPAWTGEFLRKIDLSEISFDGALLDAYSIMSIGLEEQSFSIDLSCTNANIDFKKIYTPIEYGLTTYPIISGCDFSDMDLRNSNFEFLGRINNCKFNNSQIKLEYDSMTSRAKQVLAVGIKNGSLSGAYINGKRILTHDELIEKASEIRKEYEAYEEDVKQKIIKCIH